MNTVQSTTSLDQFAWEEWDKKLFFVLYRSDRRFVVKRYIEQVFAKSSQWKQLALLSFSMIEPISQTYKITDSEMKLLHRILTWHLNGTTPFKGISGVDVLLDWEDLLDFIQRAQRASKVDQKNQNEVKTLSSAIPVIPIKVFSSKISKREISDKKENSKNLEFQKKDLTSTQVNKKIRSQQSFHDENTLLSSSDTWIQINNICVPYITKPSHTRLIPYQILLDCDLLNEKEQSILVHFTIKASSNDLETFKKVISKSSSIDFTINTDLLLIDLFHLIFGMSKVVYVKLLNNQRDVNKSYKTVLAQCGGIIKVCSRHIPFITIAEHNYILLDTLVKILQPTTQTKSALCRHSISARSHEVDYFRLVQLYQQDYHEPDSLESSRQQQQLLVNIDEIHKYVDENDLIIEMSLTQYQQFESQKLKIQIQTNDNKSRRKPTKRKASTPMTGLQVTTTQH